MGGIGAEARAARRLQRARHNSQWGAEEARHEHDRARQADHGADGAGHAGAYNYFDVEGGA